MNTLFYLEKILNFMSFHFLTTVNSHDNYSKKCYYSIVVSRRKPPCEVHLHDPGARLGGLPRSSFSSRSRQVLSTPQLTVDSVECRYLWVSAARHIELWHRRVCVCVYTRGCVKVEFVHKQMRTEGKSTTSVKMWQHFCAKRKRFPGGQE